MKPSKCMLGDAAYDSAELREQLDECGTKPVIPNRCLRWRIEAAFNRLKDFRRIATRYDRLHETISPLFASPPLLYGEFNESGP